MSIEDGTSLQDQKLNDDVSEVAVPWHLPDPLAIALCPDLCYPIPCHYLELSHSTKQGILDSQDAISWLTRGVFEPNGNKCSAESRILIYPQIRDLNSQCCLPLAYKDIQLLVEKVGFPDKFFASQLVGRKHVGHFTSPTGGSCWLFANEYFYIAVLCFKETDLKLTIISMVEGGVYLDIENIIERCATAQKYWHSPLLPIMALVDAALVEYDRRAEDQLNNADEHFHMLRYHSNVQRRSRSAFLNDFLDDYMVSKQLSISLESNLGVFLTSIEALRGLYCANSRQSGSFSLEIENIIDNQISAVGVILGKSRETNTKWKSLITSLSAIQDLRGGTRRARVRKFLNTNSQGQIVHLARLRSRKLASAKIKTAARDIDLSIRLARVLSEIALVTKQDSFSMKIVAGITIFFLPVICIVTILDKPEYGHWQLGGISLSVATSMFWIATVLITWWKYFGFYRKAEHRPVQAKSALKAAKSTLFEASSSPERDTNSACDKQVRFSDESGL